MLMNNNNNEIKVIFIMLVMILSYVYLYILHILWLILKDKCAIVNTQLHIFCT
jgi:hypothetical protein